MNKSVLFLAPLLAAFAASPVLADKGGNGKGKNKGHKGKKHHVHHDTRRSAPVLVVHESDRRPTVVVRERPPVVIRDGDRYDRDDRYDRFDGRHDNGLHLGWYKQQWRRGDRIDWEYVQPNYYIYDYRAYDLRPAPVGYRWVRPMDDRYLLVEIATGVIAEALGY